MSLIRIKLFLRLPGYFFIIPDNTRHILLWIHSKKPKSILHCWLYFLNTNIEIILYEVLDNRTELCVLLLHTYNDKFDVIFRTLIQILTSTEVQREYYLQIKRSYYNVTFVEVERLKV